MDDFLAKIDEYLAPGGKVAFVENFRGGQFLFWLRRNVLKRGRFAYESIYHGIRPEQLPLFRGRFDDVRIKRHLWLVYTILGHKRGDGD